MCGGTGGSGAGGGGGGGIVRGGGGEGGGGGGGRGVAIAWGGSGWAQKNAARKSGLEKKIETKVEASVRKEWKDSCRRPDHDL